jgi:DNA (cytosine-5)-methyltransferase 1
MRASLPRSAGPVAQAGLKYLSACSGIEAATVAWHSLGWEPVAFSEIEKFPSAVLKHHYPSVPNWGDMTKFQEWPDASVDVLVGGTPCQSFSVAGLRKGLADPRGNLALVYLGIADRYRPEWLVWENVPGVLSSNGGRDFGAFLGGLGELGYGFAYRVLDARFFGVAQRRRRVFVVANARGWQRAAAVLFERASLSGNPPPRREARQAVAPTIAGSSNGGGANGPGRDADSAASLVCVSSGQANAEIRTDGGAPSLTCLHEAPIVAQPVAWSQEIADPLTANEGRTYTHEGSNNFRTRNVQAVAQPVMFSIMPMNSGKDFKARAVEVAQPLMAGGPVGGNQGGDYVAQPVNFYGGNKRADRPDGGFYVRTDEETSKCLDAASGLNPTCSQGGTAVLQPVAFEPGSIARNAGPVGESPLAPTLRREMGDNQPAVRIDMQVRRLTPVECERLQGFPDGYTNIPWRKSPESPDGPRYKALGNSMAVPVMRWIGERIQQLEGE